MDNKKISAKTKEGKDLISEIMKKPLVWLAGQSAEIQEVVLSRIQANKI